MTIFKTAAIDRTVKKSTDRSKSKTVYREMNRLIDRNQVNRSKNLVNRSIIGSIVVESQLPQIWSDFFAEKTVSDRKSLITTCQWQLKGNIAEICTGNRQIVTFPYRYQDFLNPSLALFVFLSSHTRYSDIRIFIYFLDLVSQKVTIAIYLLNYSKERLEQVRFSSIYCIKHRELPN